jgi:hypothetical protein
LGVASSSSLETLGGVSGRAVCSRETNWLVGVVDSFIMAGVWCSDSGVPTLCSVPNVLEQSWNFLPGIAPIWSGVWLTEQLESHQTVNGCSTLCLNAIGQVGLVLMISWEPLKGIGMRLDGASSRCLDGSLMDLYLLKAVAAIGSACS